MTRDVHLDLPSEFTGFNTKHQTKIEMYLYVLVFLTTIHGIWTESPIAKVRDTLARMCHQTIRDIQCGSGHHCATRQPTQCRCDNQCLLYGDCCYDYKLQSCSGEVSDEDLPPAVDLGGEERSCVKKIQGFNTINHSPSNGYWMVSRCARGWRRSEEIKGQCEEAVRGEYENRSRELLSKLPVYYTTTKEHYRNIYCAICNHVDQDQVAYWRLDVTCKTEQPIFARVERSATDDNLTKLEEVLEQGCEVEFVKPAGASTPRQCLRTPLVKDTCHANYSDQYVISLCKSYTAYVQVDERSSFHATLYRNPHCAMCNNINYDPELFRCGIYEGGFKPPEIPLGMRPLPGISFFILFEPAESIHVPDEKVFSASSCPTGSMRDADTGGCQLILTSHSLSSTLQIQLLSDLLPNVSRADSKSRIRTHLPKWLNKKISNTVSRLDNNSSKTSVSLHNLTQLQEINIPLNTTTEMRSLMIFSADIDVTYLLAPDTNASAIKHFIRTTLDNITHSDEGHFIPEAGMVNVLSSEQSNNFLNINNNCSFIYIRHTQLQQQPEGITLRLTNDQLVDVRRGEFLFLDDSENIYVCKHVYNSIINPSLTTFTSDHPPWLSTLTFSLILLSLLSLACGLTLHASLKELRNLAGLNLAMLMLVMFLGQFLLVIQPYITAHTSPGVCVTLAALLHYLLLSFFCWMSVCAFSIYRSFTDLFGSRHTNRTKTFIHYSLYAWILPLILVGTTLALQFYGSSFLSPAPYGDFYDDNNNMNMSVETNRSSTLLKVIPASHSEICWLKNSVIFISLFGVPALLVIVTNIYFFTRSLMVIHKDGGSTKGNRQNSILHHGAIIVRITVLMGFTWLLPFLALIAHPHSTAKLILIILTDVFASLQGFFIFLAYMVRSRVLRLVREKWRSHSKNTQRRRSSDTKDTHLPSVGEERSLENASKRTADEKL